MITNSNIIQINSATPTTICQSVAGRVKGRRLEMNLKQTGLASRAGVNIETYRKFERTGEISLQNLVKIAFALNMTSDFNSLFTEKQYQNIDELLAEGGPTRKRGKKS
ncbi:MAG: helix-turn-helix transcriptional regulator [Bacteroidales bacterium]|nr:helix-turn-helix transcriptional regulator [Bacteroidales bacterium]